MMSYAFLRFPRLKVKGSTRQYSPAATPSPDFSASSKGSYGNIYLSICMYIYVPIGGI